MKIPILYALTIVVISVFYLTEPRRETSLLKQQAEAQAEELIRKKQKVEELEEKEKTANENVTISLHLSLYCLVNASISEMLHYIFSFGCC